MTDNVQDSTQASDNETDRYISFKGPDCDESARLVMDCIERQLDTWP